MIESKKLYWSGKHFLSTIAFVLTLFLPFTVYGQNVLVIEGGTIIDPAVDLQTTGTRIVVVDGIIESVSSSAPIPAGATIIDAKDRCVIPGLADMHVHFSLGLPQPRIPNETEYVLNRLLYYGVTTVLNLGASDGSGDSIKEIRDRIQDSSLSSPTVYATGGHINVPGTHPIETIFPKHVRDFAAKTLSSTPLDQPANLYDIGIGISLVRTMTAAREAVRERHRDGMDAIKITVEKGPSEFGNHHPVMPDSIMAAIVDEANSVGLPVFAHVSSLDELLAAKRNGVSGIVHAVAEAPYPDHELINSLVAGGFFVMPTLALYESFVQYLEDDSLLSLPFLRETVSEDEVSIFRSAGFLDEAPADSVQLWRSQNEETLASVGKMHAAGVDVVAGTDVGNPMVFAGWSIHQELERLVKAGLTPMDALRSATISAAQMIGKESEFGSIAPGKRGDFLILSENPLDDISNTRRISDVVARGQLVDRNELRVSF